MTLVDDAMSASMPGTAKQFLGSVQPKPIGAMIMYVAIISLLPLIGGIIGWMMGIGAFLGIGYAVLFGFLMYLGSIISVVGAGFVLGILSNGILGKQISNEEAVTLVGYAATPVMVVGFLVGIVSFVGGINVLSWVLSILAVLYMGYLIYLGAGVRYGQDKAVAATIVVLVALFIIQLIFNMIAGSILWGAVWGSYFRGGFNPYAGYNWR